ncbi:MAG: hypothetical protein ABIO70_30460 [Pseudomonadota bacterium]
MLTPLFAMLLAACGPAPAPPATPPPPTPASTAPPQHPPHAAPAACPGDLGAPDVRLVEGGPEDRDPLVFVPLAGGAGEPGRVEQQGDFNGDGVTDLVVNHGYCGSAMECMVAVYLGCGEATYRRAWGPAYAYGLYVGAEAEGGGRALVRVERGGAPGTPEDVPIAYPLVLAGGDYGDGPRIEPLPAWLAAAVRGEPAPQGQLAP